MLLNLNQKFVNMNGTILTDTMDQKELILRRVVEVALAQPGSTYKSEDAAKYYALLIKIAANKEGTVELEAEDITIIKNAVKTKYILPIIVGEALEMLEGKPISIKLAEKKPLEKEDDSEEQAV